MADGDYERGRDREIAAIAARLRRLAANRGGVKTWVCNGWAASPHAWDLCRFRRERLFSYVEQLDGLPERQLEADASKCVLVGWSMGGSTALRLACRFPDRVAGLVLIAATPRMMEERETEWTGMNARRLEALRKGLELTHGEGFFGAPEGRPNPYAMDTTENLERGLRYLLDTDIRAELERTFVNAPNRPAFPVHVFQSERDGIVRAANAEYLARIFPQARVTMVSGTEHALPIMIPKEIDDAVDACVQIA